ncbi:MAG: HAD-IA family hydrolase [Nanoarchaeota archaeon]|nr:HAD-IA family hydrolase [Nanoarchaeota archaeon]
MIKAVIFDLDNTLIDFVKMKKLAVEAAIDAMIDNGLKMEKKKAFKLMFKLYNAYGWEYQKIFGVFLKEATGKVDYKILAAGIVGYKRIKEGLIYPYPGTIDTLTKLKKNYKLAIVSDAPRIQAWTRLVSMNMQDMFDYVITFNDTHVKKPGLAPYKLALKKLNVKSNETVMIGDCYKRDMAPARRLGMMTVFAKYGESKSKGKADYIINDISELLKII